jgi:hypothetical protein
VTGAEEGGEEAGGAGTEDAFSAIAAGELC